MVKKKKKERYGRCNLKKEYSRLKELNIGKMTEIQKVHEGYYYFHIYDPDNNVCEVTGGYKEVQ